MMKRGGRGGGKVLAEITWHPIQTAKSGKRENNTKPSKHWDKKPSQKRCKSQKVFPREQEAKNNPKVGADPLSRRKGGGGSPQ